MSRKALFLFLAAGLAWGVPYFFIRIAVEDFSTYSIVLFRVLIGAAILVPLALKQGALMLALKHWPWVLGFALLEMAGPWWLITESGRHLSSGFIGLLIATGTVLATATGSTLDQWPVWLIAAVSTLIVWRTRLHILWLLGAGALVGAFVLA
jgi:drug/metabolite transporter (DMT)-like permease